MNMLYVQPIGFIRSKHIKAENTPIQPIYAEECVGTVEILPEYEDGLTDIEGFYHSILLNWLHESGACKMLVKPFMEDTEHGIFATRSPSHPNPIGLYIVRLIKRVGSLLSIQGVDIPDGTSVLDIKPYSSLFDCFPNARNGWQEAITSKDGARRGVRGCRISAGKDIIL